MLHHHATMQYSLLIFDMLPQDPPAPRFASGTIVTGLVVCRYIFYDTPQPPHDMFEHDPGAGH